MKYWLTAEDMGLTEAQVTKKLDELYKREQKTANSTCSDCGKKHKSGCDVARCVTCKGQAISCDCENSHGDVWDGMWPGTKDCYEKRLIVYSDPKRVSGIGWSFDYNALAELNARNNVTGS